MLELLDRLVGVTEQELQPAEVERHATDVAIVLELLVEGTSLLRVGPRQDQVPVRSATIEAWKYVLASVRLSAPPAQARWRLDVLARGLEVALAPATGRPPVQDLGLKPSHGRPERSAKVSASSRSPTELAILASR